MPSLRLLQASHLAVWIVMALKSVWTAISLLKTMPSSSDDPRLISGFSTESANESKVHSTQL
jgi:hypothetical protein